MAQRQGAKSLVGTWGRFWAGDAMAWGRGGAKVLETRADHLVRLGNELRCSRAREATRGLHSSTSSAQAALATGAGGAARALLGRHQGGLALSQPNLPIARLVCRHLSQQRGALGSQIQSIRSQVLRCRGPGSGSQSVASIRTAAVSFRHMASSSWCTSGRLQAYQGLLPASIVSALALRRALPPSLVRSLGIVSLAVSRSHPVTRGLGLLLGEASVRLQRWMAAGGDSSLMKAHALSQQAFLSQLPPSPPPFSVWSSLFWNGGNLLLRANGLFYVIGSNIVEWGVMVLRAAFLVGLFLPAVVTGPLAHRLGGEHRKRWLRLVRRSLERAGPAFIKWGQWAATRPDLFPRDMCSELKNLHSKAPAHDYLTTRRTVERAFGCQLSDIFVHFDVEPIASGSIAQVHRAVLRSRPARDHSDVTPEGALPLHSAAHDWQMEPLALPPAQGSLTPWRPSSTMKRLMLSSPGAGAGAHPDTETQDTAAGAGTGTGTGTGVVVAKEAEKGEGKVLGFVSRTLGGRLGLGWPGLGLGLFSRVKSAEQEARERESTNRWLMQLGGDEMQEERVVAVKVRHPGVREVIHRDFLIMNAFARVSSFVPGLRWLRLEDSVAQFAIFMMAQVDLAREAAQLSRFNYNFRRWRSVSFPRPLYPLVHPEVLVETFEAGESVSRYVDRNAPRGDPLNAELADLGSGVLLKMILVDNFVHADLHPGNILVRMQRAVVPFRPLWWSNLLGLPMHAVPMTGVANPNAITPTTPRSARPRRSVPAESGSGETGGEGGGESGSEQGRGGGVFVKTAIQLEGAEGKEGGNGGGSSSGVGGVSSKGASKVVQRINSSLEGILYNRIAHPHIVLLDVGMTAELCPAYRENMLSFWRAITIRDGRAAAESTLRFTQHQSCPDREAFINSVDKSFKAWDKMRDFVPAGECMQELLEQIRRHRVNIDGDVCTVIITTLVLESWQRKLDPDLSFMDTLKSLLFRSELISSLRFTIDGLLGP